MSITDLQSFIQEHVDSIVLPWVTVKHPVGRKDVWIVGIDPDAQRRLDSGRTWLESVQYDTVTLALEAAQKVNKALEEHWQVDLVLKRARQAVYTVAMDVASVLQDGVEWRD